MEKNQNGLDDSAIDVPISLPKEVVKRVNALKNIQLKMVNIETKFYEELHHLECRYAAMYEPLYEEREKIVTGVHEPSEEEGKWALDEELAKDLEKKATITEAPESPEAADVKGIPEFWLHAMKSTEIIGEAIQEHDEPILKHLRDVRVKLHDQKPFGYTLEFVFDENEFFTNNVLTKTYELTTDKDDKDPFGYDGPALYKSIGCKIDWKPEKDVSVKLVKKKQKHKSSGTIRVVTKEEKQDSFFNFFESPTPDGIRPSYRHILDPSYTPKEENEEQDEEDEELYEADFEIGHFFKEFLIPKAVLYYTGELVDESSYDDEEYDDEEEDDGEEHGENSEDDDEEEDDEEETKSKGKKSAKKHPKA
ncbi:unnamed protein product [Brachionus calyciflorus]|uniref:Uncharacterized protein n=1 Tax=Brachionus calyciflorus TaxID=104777 RepID=A0A813PGN5_9BILA|nr:unnamed protein product [Brachionus calyciflorus]